MAGRISIDNLSNSLKDIIEQSGLTEAQVIELIKNNTGDISQLNTTNKSSLVAAINELFQNANNGKELIANAIGEPLSSNDTFSAMSNDINGLLSTFKTNMMNNGITVESTDKFKSLIDKIATLADSEGNKGIQFAEGTCTVTNSLITHNCGFIPTYFFVLAGSIRMQYKTSSGYYNDILFNPVISNIKMFGSDPSYGISGSSSITELNEFTAKISNISGNVTWYAIGVGEEDTTLRDSLASILQEEGVTVTEEDDMASLIGKVDSEFNAKENEIIDMKQDLKDVLVNKGVDVGGANNITSLINKVNDLNVVNTPNFAMNYSIGNFTPFKNPNEREFEYKVPVYCNGKVYYMHLAQHANTTNFSVDLNTMEVTTGLKASDVTQYNNYRFHTNYCVFGTDIYLIGGETGVSTTEWDTNWCYNTLNNTWTAKKARPAEVAECDVIRCNNRIYTISGATESYYYTPSSNTWTQISVGFFGKVLVAKDNNTIYGFNGKNMYILNTQTNTFETKSNVLTVSLAFGSTGVYLKDHIYILQRQYIYRIDPSTGLIDGQSNQLYNADRMYKYNDTCAIIMDKMGNGWIFEP